MIDGEKNNCENCGSCYGQYNENKETNYTEYWCRLSEYIPKKRHFLIAWLFNFKPKYIKKTPKGLCQFCNPKSKLYVRKGQENIISL